MFKIIKTNFTILAIAFGVLSGCTNMASLKTSTPKVILTNASFGTGSVSYTHSMQNVNLGTTTATPPALLLSLSVVAGASPLTQFCTVGSGGTLPCSCMLTWKEINTVSGGNVSIDRTRKLPVTAVQGTLVQCQMDQAFWNEIPSGTVMRMNIVGISPNTSGLTVKDIGYKKGTSVAATGDFVDDTLTPFRNILRYSCYSKRSAATEILNEFATASTQATATTPAQTVNIYKASAFCVNGQNCGSVRVENSAQSYYRNLYVRSDTAGQIVSSNARYECPEVFEKITAKATTPPTASATDPYHFWPMDAMFSVSLTRSTEWSVPVTAGSYLMKNGEPSDAMASSERLVEVNTSGSGGNSGIVWKILGYGKLPNADGTCGTIVDSTGKIRPLTRLRRYRVIYPPVFQDNGQPVNERLEADQILVPDRLVVDSTGALTGNMIYGPKPCNFAWFDHEGVTNRSSNSNANFRSSVSDGMPGYVATSQYYYRDQLLGVDIAVNPDGKILPNFDRASSNGALDGPSCSAAIAIYDSVGGVPVRARLLTSYFNRTDKITLGSRDFYLRELHMNPVERWNPRYVEDVTFKACVPAADPYIEPPLHFYRDGNGQVAWCAKAYPTQNPYWEFLNAKKKFNGSTSMSNRIINWGSVAPNTNEALVKWYTSHKDSGAGLDTLTTDAAGTVFANACTSTDEAKICETSLGATSTDFSGCKTFLKNKLITDSAVNNRCDRTVKYDPLNTTSRGFPLLAKDDDIKDMLENDMGKTKSFACMYSVHSNPNKVGVAQPMSNCCGIKNGRKILDPTVRLPVNTSANEGHLEPYLDPAFPASRFCGNPVE